MSTEGYPDGTKVIINNKCSRSELVNATGIALTRRAPDSGGYLVFFKGWKGGYPGHLLNKRNIRQDILDKYKLTARDVEKSCYWVDITQFKAVKIKPITPQEHASITSLLDKLDNLKNKY